MVITKTRFTEKERREFLFQLDQFLEGNHWIKKSDKNGSIVFKKKNFSKNNDFLQLSKKKGLPSLNEQITYLSSFFYNLSFERKVSEKIALTDGVAGESFLIGSGIQNFRDLFWGEKALKKSKFFIPQPVIRTQYINQIREGCTSSFVNVTTAGLNYEFKDHLRTLDTWFSLFSKMGLHMNDFNLNLVPKERYSLNKKGIWSNTDGISLGINYQNLNLGDAGFIKLPNKDEFISDIGFGLERILWAVNKTNSYFSLIGPELESEKKRYAVMDSTRSATLLSMTNISEANKDSINQFRKFTKKLSKHYGNFDLYRLVEHYHSYWSNFLNEQKPLALTYYFLRKEIENEKRNL